MKRYVCTVATGLLLALVSTGTATAIEPLPLPLPGQSGTQEATFGDQTAQQSNDADVSQKQGNGNVNVAPAIAIFGDAETKTVQGSGNTATANVDQSNSADQSQSSEQKQSLDQDGGTCCGGQSQTGEQTADFGDQTAQQNNTADVDQWQGNGNLNIAPAVAIFGDAETKTVQGSGNEANADVTQSNAASQSQDSTQKQWLDQDGGTCCGGQSQTGQQTATFSDQTAQQSNDADVSQKQGNGNVNVAPAIAIFGDAETKTVQGSGNTATANVDQSNSADQSQSSEQKQSLDQDGGTCCGGQSQTGEQTADFGDQTAQQNNTADVDQWQGNGNLNIAPAVAIFGDAETKTVQGSGNEANADVTQSNAASQSQDSTQKQWLDQDGGGCCKPPVHCDKPDKCSLKKEYGEYPKAGKKDGNSCCDGQSQTGEQTATFGDQTAQQSNNAYVTQKQGNGNLNVAPAIAFGKGKGRESSCYSKCEKSGYGGHSFGGDAETTTVQGSGNEATANVDQSNSADQSQSSEQLQSLEQDGGGCCKPRTHCDKPDPCSPNGYEPAKGSYGKEGQQDRCCAHGQNQTGEQTATFGDQTAQQNNTAEVTQKQGNLNGSFAPAIAFGKGKGKPGNSCGSKCGKPAYGGHSFGGDAETTTVQGSGNEATANVDQSNSADQSQTSYQRQNVVDMCKGLIYR